MVIASECWVCTTNFWHQELVERNEERLQIWRWDNFRLECLYLGEGTGLKMATSCFEEATYASVSLAVLQCQKKEFMDRVLDHFDVTFKPPFNGSTAFYRGPIDPDDILYHAGSPPHPD